MKVLALQAQSISVKLLVHLAFGHCNVYLVNYLKFFICFVNFYVLFLIKYIYKATVLKYINPRRMFKNVSTLWR